MKKHPSKALVEGMLIIVVLLILLLFASNNVTVIDGTKPSAFEVDQLLIKVLLKESESFQKQVRIMNTGEDIARIDVSSSLPDTVLSFSESSFEIRPGQTKMVSLVFSGGTGTVFAEPGVLVGSLTVTDRSSERLVPLIVEIESETVLFDMNINPVARARTITRGSSENVEIRVFNLNDLDAYTVLMRYEVKDVKGNTIISEQENVIVQTQASFFKTITIPDYLPSASYIFAATAEFGSSLGTASYLFEVIDPEIPPAAPVLGISCGDDPMCWLLVTVIVLLVIIVISYLYVFAGVAALTLRREKRKKAKQVTKKPEHHVRKTFSHIAHSIGAWAERQREHHERVHQERLILKARREQYRKAAEARRRKKLKNDRAQSKKKLLAMLKKIRLPRFKTKPKTGRLRRKKKLKQPEKKSEKPKQKKTKMVSREHKFKEENKLLRKGKSKLFVKTHKRLLLSNDKLDEKDYDVARRYYLKTWKLYLRLEYDEKKELYKSLVALYARLKKVIKE